MQCNIEIEKPFVLSVNIQSRLQLLSNFLQEDTQITMWWPWW